MIFTATSEHLCDVLMFDPENVRSEHNDHPSQVTIDLRLDKNKSDESFHFKFDLTLNDGPTW